jgi:hypothetical protein
MLKIRLLGFFLLAIPAFAEYYEYINNPRSKRRTPLPIALNTPPYLHFTLNIDISMTASSVSNVLCMYVCYVCYVCIVGPNSWMGITLMIMELLICIKFGRGNRLASTINILLARSFICACSYDV